MASPFNRYRVCLVGTQIPENLGSVARIMTNFGFSRLCLVSPMMPALHPQADRVARRGRSLLASAEVTQSLDDALVGASVVVGMTARQGDRRETMTPRRLVERLAALGETDEVSLVFGREDSGLSTEETDRCDLLCTIPTRGELSSLNLAQAVAVILWEVSQVDARLGDPNRDVAKRGAIEGLLDHAFEVLERIGYLEHKDADKVRSDVRRMLAAARLSQDQVRSLRGVCRQALWALRRLAE